MFGFGGLADPGRADDPHDLGRVSLARAGTASFDMFTAKTIRRQNPQQSRIERILWTHVVRSSLLIQPRQKRSAAGRYGVYCNSGDWTFSFPSSAEEG